MNKLLTSPWELYDNKLKDLELYRVLYSQKEISENKKLNKEYPLFDYNSESVFYNEREYNNNNKFISLPSKSEYNKINKYLEVFNKTLDDKEKGNKEYLTKRKEYLLKNSISEEVYKSYQLFEFVENIINMIYELKWKSEFFAKKTVFYNLKNSNKETPLPWRQVKEILRPSDKEPPMSIIIRIIDSFENRLIKLAETPRKVLKRTRKKEHLSRIQQIDPSCLEWLTKQPGVTATEKAGSQQKIMAIVRDEDFDTLENRVLKDMLVRCNNECFDFINKYYTKYKDTVRYNSVLKFSRKCQQVLKLEHLKKIGGLRKIPTPNYVLRFDSIYKDVWFWYQELVKKESDTEKIWKWQHLLWKDFVLLNITSAFYDYIQNTDTENLWISREQINGSWIKTKPWSTELYFKYKNNEFLSSFFIPKSIPDSFKYFDMNIANILGLTGSDLLIYLNEVNSMRQYGILVWSLHLLDDIDKAYQQIVELKKQFNKKYNQTFYFCLCVSSPFEQNNDLQVKENDIFIIKSYSESNELETWFEMLISSILDKVTIMEAEQ